MILFSDRPDPPASVVVERCREKQADISWVKGIENNAPVIHFIVQYNTTFNPDQWSSVKTVNYAENTATIDLLPWANYTFRVIATNKIGASTPSVQTSKVCTTNPQRPSRNPQNLRSVGDKYGTLKIEWIVSILMKEKCVLMYVVRLKHQGKNNVGANCSDLTKFLPTLWE